MLYDDIPLTGSWILVEINEPKSCNLIQYFIRTFRPHCRNGARVVAIIFLDFVMNVCQQKIGGITFLLSLMLFTGQV